jgi:sugar lactone lactonase YvrE
VRGQSGRSGGAACVGWTCWPATSCPWRPAARSTGTTSAASSPPFDLATGVERGFALEDPDGTLTHLGELWSDNNVRMNEGGCDPDGRFYCGSMAYDQRPSAGALYRLDPDGSVHEALENVTISNGLEWSPDGSRAYYNDTPTHRIDVFD